MCKPQCAAGECETVVLLPIKCPIRSLFETILIGQAEMV